MGDLIWLELTYNLFSKGLGQTTLVINIPKTEAGTWHNEQTKTPKEHQTIKNNSVLIVRDVTKFQPMFLSQNC